MTHKTPKQVAVALLLSAIFCQSPTFAADAKRQPASESKPAQTKVITYPAPAGEKVLRGYKVFVNGKQIDLYTAQSRLFETMKGSGYTFGYFDFEGEVEVKVVAPPNHPFDLKKLELLPARPIAKASKTSFTFKADKPFKISVLPDERNRPLIIFGNALEKSRPQKSDPNLLYFGPGVHAAEQITLTSNQTLYIAGGAVVKTIVLAQGENIKILGRGVISGELHARQTCGKLVRFNKCKNIAIDGVILRDPPHWTLSVDNTDGAVVSDVKVCSGRMINDDALDICNSRNVAVRDCFLRSQDDNVALKANGGSIAVENILIENCIFWTDLANTFRIGFECNNETMQNVVVRNCLVAFSTPDPSKDITHFWVKGVFLFQAANEMVMKNFTFENIKIRSDGVDVPVVVAVPRVIDFYDFHKFRKSPGSIRDCKFKNISVFGKKSGLTLTREKSKFVGTLWFKGYDASHTVENMSFENITYFGKKITKDSPNVRIEEFTSNITF